jgi:DNA polymerase III epsilon subunit-like protein
MTGIKFNLIDIESSGLRAGFHDLVEISVIRYDDRTQITRQVKAENPNNASFDALLITGKTIEDLKKGIHSKQMIEDVNGFFDSDGLTPPHRCIVGHNVSFDKQFIHYIWGKYNQRFPADLWLDTLALCRRVVKREGIVKPSLKLNDACDLFGIKKVATSHNAKADSQNAFLLFKYFMDRKEDFLDLIKIIPHNIE